MRVFPDGSGAVRREGIGVATELWVVQLAGKTGTWMREDTGILDGRPVGMNTVVCCDAL